MREFFTVKALLNAWNQMGMKTYPSDSKAPILSASRFASIGCAYVHFSFLPESEFFCVTFVYYKDGQRIEKRCQTTDLRKAMKAAYLYTEELNTL